MIFTPSRPCDCHLKVSQREFERHLCRSVRSRACSSEALNSLNQQAKAAGSRPGFKSLCATSRSWHTETPSTTSAPNSKGPRREIIALPVGSRASQPADTSASPMHTPSACMQSLLRQLMTWLAVREGAQGLTVHKLRRRVQVYASAMQHHSLKYELHSGSLMAR